MPTKLGSVKINRSALNDAVLLGRATSNFLSERARIAANIEFERRKLEVLSEIDENSISQEIRAGARAESETLGYGNLFSYIGFNKGTNPVQSFKSVFEDEKLFYVSNTSTRNQKLGRYYFNVYAPTRKDIAAATASDLGTLVVDSWPHAIEEGFTNFNKYLYSLKREFPQSNSGPAIQVKAVVEQREFPNLAGQYVTKVFRVITEGKY